MLGRREKVDANAAIAIPASIREIVQDDNTHRMSLKDP